MRIIDLVAETKTNVAQTNTGDVEMDITEKLDLIIAELRAAREELVKLGQELDGEQEDRLDRAIQQRRAHAAVDWAWKGKTPRVVYDWTNGKVGVVSGKEKIL